MKIILHTRKCARRTKPSSTILSKRILMYPSINIPTQAPFIPAHSVTKRPRNRVPSASRYGIVTRFARENTGDYTNENARRVLLARSKWESGTGSTAACFAILSRVVLPSADTTTLNMSCIVSQRDTIAPLPNYFAHLLKFFLIFFPEKIRVSGVDAEGHDSFVEHHSRPENRINWMSFANRFVSGIFVLPEQTMISKPFRQDVVIFVVAACTYHFYTDSRK